MSEVGTNTFVSHWKWNIKNLNEIPAPRTIMTWDVWHHKRRILLKQDCVKEFPFPLIRDNFNGNASHYIWPFCRSLVCSFVTSLTGFRFQRKSFGFILKALKGKGYALLEMGRHPIWQCSDRKCLLCENYFTKNKSFKVCVRSGTCFDKTVGEMWVSISHHYKRL